jgi:50S ribosomal subunit-associated GTPase HflX
VGFIRELPKDLFAAFRATFEEAEDADLLLHVVDVSDPAMSEHIKTTEQLLGELGLAQVPTLIVLNKCDRLSIAEVESIARQRDAVPVSAIDPGSFAPLLARMDRMLAEAVSREGDLTRSGEMRTGRDLARPSGLVQATTSVRLAAVRDELAEPYFDDAAIDDVIKAAGGSR